MIHTYIHAHTYILVKGILQHIPTFFKRIFMLHIHIHKRTLFGMFMIHVHIHIHLARHFHDSHIYAFCKAFSWFHIYTFCKAFSWPHMYIFCKAFSYFHIYTFCKAFLLPTQHIYIFCLKGVFYMLPHFEWHFFMVNVHISFTYILYSWKAFFLLRCKVSTMMQPKPSASLTKTLPTCSHFYAFFYTQDQKDWIPRPKSYFWHFILASTNCPHTHNGSHMWTIHSTS